jgi:proteasome lid subunit RPN8/RPN11
VVVVTDHLAVQSDSKSALHFDFDKRSIGMILARLEGSADYVVGWYHSHIIGSPFMSSIDHDNHREHFPLPWYVSCVVASGEWGLPVDFWQLVDDELVNIGEYAIDIASEETATDTHQEFLRACQVPSSPVRVSPEYLAGLLPEVGMRADDTVGRALLDSLPGDCLATRLDEFRLVVDLAAALAADPGAADKIAQLRGRLSAALSYEGKLVRELISDRLADQFAFCRRRGVSVTRGDNAVNWFDLRYDVTYPVSLDAPILAASFSADGAVWLLSGGGSVIRMVPAARIIGEMEGPLFHTDRYSIPKLKGEPRQVAADEANLWVTTSEHWYRIPIGPEQQRIRVGQMLELPDADEHFLLDGFIGPLSPDRLLTLARGCLQTWGPDGSGIRKIAEQALAEPWSRWRLTGACCGAEGLYLLFDDGEKGQLGLFDRESLTPTHHYMYDISDTGMLPPSEARADPFGRVYLRCGSVLCRLRP